MQVLRSKRKEPLGTDQFAMNIGSARGIARNLPPRKLSPPEVESEGTQWHTSSWWRLYNKLTRI